MATSRLSSGKRKLAASPIDKPVATVLRLHNAPSTRRAGPIGDDELNTNRASLRQRDLFENLSAHERAQVLAKCAEHDIKSGALLYTQGTRHIDTYIIKQGLI